MAKVIKAGIFVGTILTVGLLLGGCDDTKRDEAAALRMPEKFDARVEFRPGRKDREGARTVLYAPDGKIKIGAIIPFESGKVTHIEYWTDGPSVGQIKTAKTFYKPVEGNPLPQLQRELEYSRDGSGLVFDRQYRPDSSLLHAGSRVGAFYETYDFLADGRGFVAHRRFIQKDKTWVVELLEEYYPNQVLSKLMKRNAKNTTETQLFSEEGIVQSRTVVSEWGNEVTTERFNKDGQEVLVRIHESYVRTTVRHFQNGVLTLEREFMYGYTPTIPGVMWVTFFDDKGQAKYRQRLTIDWTTIGKLMEATDSTKIKIENSMYQLQEIQYLVAGPIGLDGTPKLNVSKSIQFQSDGKTPKEITTKPGNGERYPDQVMTFRADGTLEKLKEHDAKGTTVKVKTHTAVENVRVPVDPEVMKIRPFDEVPNTLTRVAYRGGPDDR